MRVSFAQVKLPGLPPDLQEYLAHIRSTLSFRQVYEAYGWHWITDETHQLSCPFHGKHVGQNGQRYEGDPSARYYADDRCFYCHACEFGGDIVWFISKVEKLPFRDTLRLIEERFGINKPQINLAERIAKAQQKTDERPFKEEIFKKYKDLINDTLYRLNKLCPEMESALDRVTVAIFKRGFELQESQAPYIQFAESVRGWNQWAMDLLKMTWLRWHEERGQHGRHQNGDLSDVQ